MNLEQHPNRENIVDELKNDIHTALNSDNNDDTYKNLYFKTGGVFRTLLEVISLFLEKMYQELYKFIPNLFAHTATGNWLDKHAAKFNISREPATKTIGYVTFQIDLTSRSKITVPKGKILATKPDSKGDILRYITDETVESTPEHTGDIKVKVVAEYEGSKYNVSEHKITQIVTPINGIESITNKEKWINEIGRDIESDQSLQQRCTAFWGSINGANQTAYESWAKSFRDVKYAVAFPDKDIQGKAYVYVSGHNSIKIGNEIISQIQNYIDQNRPIGTEIIVREPYTVTIDLNIRITHIGSSELHPKIIIEEKVQEFFKMQTIGQSFEVSALSAYLFSLSNIKSIDINITNINTEQAQKKQQNNEPTSSIPITMVQIIKQGDINIERYSELQG